jgi:hypothetical protein
VRVYDGARQNVQRGRSGASLLDLAHRCPVRRGVVSRAAAALLPSPHSLPFGIVRDSLPFTPRRLAVSTLLLLVVAQPHTPAQSPSARLVAARRDARDADLRADWTALVRARESIVRLVGDSTLGAWPHYYAAYADYRMSQLAFMGRGPGGQLPLLARCVGELGRAMQIDSALADVHALLAVCRGLLYGTDPSRRDSVGVILRERDRALELGPRNPRVQLLRAMQDYVLPPAIGGGQEKAVARWEEAIAMFGAEKSTGLAPDWGHAEAVAWLGGAFLMRGEHARAVPLLERAVAMRSDFWWARDIALPQAKLAQP